MRHFDHFSLHPFTFSRLRSSDLSLHQGRDFEGPCNIIIDTRPQAPPAVISPAKLYFRSSHRDALPPSTVCQFDRRDFHSKKASVRRGRIMYPRQPRRLRLSQAHQWHPTAIIHPIDGEPPVLEVRFFYIHLFLALFNPILLFEVYA